MLRPTDASASLIRIGVLALPLAGLLFLLISVLSSYSNPGPDAGPTATARWASSLGYIALQLGYVSGNVLLIFGLVALLAYLASTRSRWFALAAILASVSGIALVLTITGLAIYAFSGLSRAFLERLLTEEAFLGAVNAIPSSAPQVWASNAGPLLYTIGATLFAVGVWHSGSLPKWVAGPLAVHAPLLFQPQVALRLPIPPWMPYALQYLGSVLLLLAGVGIAWVVFRRPFAGQPTETAPSRRHEDQVRERVESPDQEEDGSPPPREDPTATQEGSLTSRAAADPARLAGTSSSWKNRMVS